MLWETDDGTGERFIISAPNWQDWRRQSTSFEHMAIWEQSRFNWPGDQEPEQVFGIRASSGLFPMLGIAATTGTHVHRIRRSARHTTSWSSMTVCGDAASDARPDVIGQTMRVNGKPHEIIGVMPPHFIFDTEPS